jgi:pimeloyl-ACP methyl ester carboxylesterase
MKWLDRKEYPFESKYLNINGQSLHYIDEGKGAVLLFVHGTPSWSFDFRHLIKKLSKRYRCIAIDHIGFGLSDKPEQYDYSTINHGKTLEAFVRYLSLREITLIVHDFGGPIGFYFAINNPQLVRNYVVFNSWLWSSASDPEFMKLSKVLKSPLLPFLYLYLNFSPRFLLPLSFAKNKPIAKILRHYTRPFSKRSERYGALAFAKSLVHDQEWFESLWNGKGEIASSAVLFIWGVRDKFVTPDYLEKFESGFGNSETILLKECGHFPQEEEPDVVAEAIRSFVEKSLIENDRTVSIDKNTVIQNKFK